MKPLSDNFDIPLELAIIGYSQAGKTTLAVGLYATSTEEFTVIGDGEETEDYLRTRKAQLETGHWLSASQERDRPELCLKLGRQGGSPVRVRFREYMGELACNTENFKRQIIGRPRGALILLNPKMDILADPIRRVEMLAQLREIVDYLASPQVTCEYVALVTTASDFLEDCDSEVKSAFDGYKAEIVNALKTSSFGVRHAWKEFSVTVSGRLQDPDRPRIAKGAENTSRLPFVWIIEQIERAAHEARKRRKRRRIFFASMTTVALLALAGISWFFGIDRSAERHLLSRAKEPRSELEKAIGIKDEAKIDRSTRDLEELVITSLTEKIYFAANSNRLAGLVREIRDQIDAGRTIWASWRIDDMRKNAKTDASESECEKWRKEFSDWQPNTDASRKCREEMLKKFDESVDSWRQTYEIHHYRGQGEALGTKLREYQSKDDESGNKFHDLLAECRKFERNADAENAVQLVSMSDCAAVWNSIRKVRKDALETFVEQRLSQLKADAPVCPEYNEDLRKLFEEQIFSEDVLQGEDKAETLQFIKNTISKKKAEWRTDQDEKCDAFLLKCARQKPIDAVRDFRTFEQNYSQAPKFEKVADAIHDKVGFEFRRLIDELKNGSCSDFSQNHMNIRELCDSVYHIKSPRFHRRCWYAFAENCQTNGYLKSVKESFPQTFTIERIKVHTTAKSLTDNPQKLKFEYYFEADYGNDEKKERVTPTFVHEAEIVKGDGEFVIQAPTEILAVGNVWRPVKLVIFGSSAGKSHGCFELKCGEIRESGVLEKELGTRQFRDKFLWKENTDCDVSVKVDLKCTGKFIWDILPENQVRNLE